MKRALYERIADHIGDLPPHFTLNEPQLYATTSPETRQVIFICKLIATKEAQKDPLIMSLRAWSWLNQLMILWSQNWLYTYSFLDYPQIKQALLWSIKCKFLHLRFA